MKAPVLVTTLARSGSHHVSWHVLWTAQREFVSSRSSLFVEVSFGAQSPKVGLKITLCDRPGLNLKTVDEYYNLKWLNFRGKKPYTPTPRYGEIKLHYLSL